MDMNALKDFFLKDRFAVLAVTEMVPVSVAVQKELKIVIKMAEPWRFPAVM